jgi:hypothetical protein
MKLRKALAISAVLAGLCVTGSAIAQSGLRITCEQGAPTSWKFCEAIPETYASYVWTTSGTAVLDPYVCTTSSNVCTAWCSHTSSQGYLHLTAYNASGTPVASATKALGCAGG